MHIHKFADLCEFSEIGVNGTFEETQKYRQFLKNLHPRQILNMQISLALYQVVYSYTTIRGNYREGKKYFFANLVTSASLEDDSTSNAVIKSLSRRLSEPLSACINLKAFVTVLYAFCN